MKIHIVGLAYHLTGTGMPNMQNITYIQYVQYMQYIPYIHTIHFALLAIGAPGYDARPTRHDASMTHCMFKFTCEVGIWDVEFGT